LLTEPHKTNLPFRPFMRPVVFVLALLAGCAGAFAQQLLELERQLVRICEEARASVVSVAAHREWLGVSGGSYRTSYSGVVWDNQGHIVTVAAAVINADSVQVTTLDGEKFPAKIVGVDERSDTALLRVKSQELKPVRIGKSEDVKVGSFIVTIGNPFGLRGSVCTGIVSGLNRRVERGDYPLYGMIQITAPINPGDAGGAVLNSRGELIGIVHSTFGRAPSFSGMCIVLRNLMTGIDARHTALTQIAAEGINFAMPVDAVKPIVKQLAKHGRVRRSWLGVAVRTVRRDIPAEERQNASFGVLVIKVMRNSPAFKAGIEPGDVITHLDEKLVTDVEQFARAISLQEAGRVINLRAIHEGKPVVYKVAVEEEPEHLEKYVRRMEELSILLESGLAGADIRDLTPSVVEKFHINGGVLVANVVPDSPADCAGVRAGDVITYFGGRRVRNRAELLKALRESLRRSPEQGEFRIEIYRNGKKVLLVWK